MPVLRQHDALRSLMSDEDAAPKRRIDYVTDNHSIRGRPHRLDSRSDVHTRVQPDRPRPGAPPQDGSVAQAPLAAESEAVGLPSGQGELERAGRQSGC
jgi:hypothetical protein